MMSPPLFASVTGRSKTFRSRIASIASPQMSACFASLRESSMYPSLLFVSTVVHLSIAEKVGEFAVLRSLGFSATRLRTMMFTIVGTQVVVAVALAIPFSLALVQFLNQRMGEAWFSVHLHSNVSDFVLPMLAALVIAPVVALLGARAILNVDIPTQIRGRSI